MKTFTLFFVLLLTVAQADEWRVNGRLYKGTIHKFSPDRAKVWVTSDWDNYGGSWLKTADLDAATRVRLGVATVEEQASVKAANEQAAAEAKARAEQQAIFNAMKAQQAAADAQAQRDAQQADYQGRMLALREREVRAKEREAYALAQVSRWQVYLPPNSQFTYSQRGGYPQVTYTQGGSQQGYGYQSPGYQSGYGYQSPGYRRTRVPAVSQGPRRPVVPQVRVPQIRLPQVPQVTPVVPGFTIYH